MRCVTYVQLDGCLCKVASTKGNLTSHECPQVELAELDAGKDTTYDPERRAEDSQDEEMDDIDILMLQERLGLEVEQQLEDLEAQGLSSQDLDRLLSLEGRRCCDDTGLKVLLPASIAIPSAAADSQRSCSMPGTAQHFAVKVVKLNAFVPWALP